MGNDLFINDTWMAGRGAALSSTDPATGNTVWKGRTASRNQLDEAVEAAHGAFGAWFEAGEESRSAVVRCFAELLQQNQETLARTISLETGKPLWESRTEVKSMHGKVDVSIRAMAERAGTRKDSGTEATSVVRHKPHGVIAVFGPFNFPGHLPNGHITPALLAGNTVVFKPSSHTPLVALETVKLWQQAGLPPGVLNLVLCRGRAGMQLAGHPRVDGIFFTGSTETGRRLLQRLGTQPQKILALEMGGNNPMVVFRPADLKAAIHHTLTSAYLSAGQRCTCARRLLVTGDAQGDAFLEGLVRAIERLHVAPFDDPRQPFMGPVICEEAADRLLTSQETFLADGGIPLVKMRKLKPGTALLSPGLMDRTGTRDRTDEECFGPFLQLFRYRDFDEAIRMANDTRFGLAAALLCDDPDLYRRFYLRVRAGIINWNRPLTGASSTAPFGGIGVSGNHRPGAYYAADYCAYPVSSLESDSLTLPDSLSPGIAL